MQWNPKSEVRGQMSKGAQAFNLLLSDLTMGTACPQAVERKRRCCPRHEGVPSPVSSSPASRHCLGAFGQVFYVLSEMMPLDKITDKIGRAARTVTFLALLLVGALASSATAATYVVTTIADHAADVCDAAECTLREAITAANAGNDNTIRFAPGVTGYINLTSPLPVLSRNLTIIGPGADVLTVRRVHGGHYRIFTIRNGTSPGPVITVQGLTLNNAITEYGPENGAGGCIYNDRGTLRILKCAMTQNHAGTGSVVYNLSGTVEISDSTVSGNTVSASWGGNGPTYSGGAFVNYAGEGPASLMISNTTLTGNSGDRGAVVHNSAANGSAMVKVQNCTLSYNTPGTGGDIYNGGNLANVVLENTILRGAVPFFPTIVNENGATITSHGNNLSNDKEGGDSSTGPGGWLNQPGDKRNTDPRLAAALAANGGTTQTIALMPDSPAINAGNDTFAPPRDQRGYLRPDRSDIGAFEFRGTIPVSLANLSTRLRTESGDNALIGGFIISGNQSKRLIVRAIGPSLSMNGQLENPVLELFNSSAQSIAVNDNWNDAPNRQEIIDSFLAPAHHLESAILVTLSPGAYTAIVRGVNDTTGIAVAELYDLDRTSTSTLANISTRGRVQTGANVMIGGFIVFGQDSQKVIIRAIGPSLSSGALQDPILELFNSNGALVRANNDWRDAQEEEIRATGIPPAHNAESAIVATLAPGAYTAVVGGHNNTTGIALVEVYAIR